MIPSKAFFSSKDTVHLEFLAGSNLVVKIPFSGSGVFLNAGENLYLSVKTANQMSHNLDVFHRKLSPKPTVQKLKQIQT